MTSAGSRLSSVRLHTMAMVGGLFALFAACASGPPGPAALDARHEVCQHCRMTVSDQRLAAQVVAPGDEPLFFDDIGCLAAHLAAGNRVPADGAVYVADHRTKAWVSADGAVYTRAPGIETPMGSHVIAHTDAASRAQDPDAAQGTPLTPRDVFGTATPLTRAR